MWPYICTTVLSDIITGAAEPIRLVQPIEMQLQCNPSQLSSYTGLVLFPLLQLHRGLMASVQKAVLLHPELTLLLLQRKRSNLIHYMRSICGTKVI